MPLYGTNPVSLWEITVKDAVRDTFYSGDYRGEIAEGIRAFYNQQYNRYKVCLYCSIWIKFKSELITRKGKKCPNGIVETGRSVLAVKLLYDDRVRIFFGRRPNST